MESELTFYEPNVGVLLLFALRGKLSKDFLHMKSFKTGLFPKKSVQTGLFLTEVFSEGFSFISKLLKRECETQAQKKPKKSRPRSRW